VSLCINDIDVNYLQTEIDAVAQKMGVSKLANPIDFIEQIPHANGQFVAGMGLPSGRVFIDAGLVYPQLTNSPRFAKLTLRARIEVLLVHEIEGINYRKTSNLELGSRTHGPAVIRGPGTSLSISQEARNYLKYWAEECGDKPLP